MSLETLRRLRGVAAEGRLLFSFEGDLSARAVADLVEAVRARLEEAAVPAGARRRLLSTVVELAQNVVHYAAGAGPGGARRGLLALGASGPGYWVICANLVPAGLGPRLAGRLEAIRAMSPAQVRAAYRRKLGDEAHEAVDTLSRGAGLGLLTVARHATAPLEWALDRAPPGDHLVFQLCARIDPQTLARSPE